MSEQKRIVFRVVETFQADERYFGVSMFTSTAHGPFRFTSLGIGFGPLDNPCFVPWVRVLGVDGWEPPERKAEPEAPVTNEAKTKFRPQ